jgi:hypothetical protein
MVDSWTFSDGAHPVSPEEALSGLRERIAEGRLESWLISSSGRRLAVVSNTERAMVMLLEDDDDPGEHAIDPDAVGWSEGFVLENGQHDAYRNKDTVPLEEAFRIAGHILSSGSPPSDTAWAVDR